METKPRLCKRMETPLFGLRSKAELFGKAFFHALKQEEEEETHDGPLDEQVSLESAFRRFVTAPDVITYYCLVPLIGDVLEEVKNRCMGNQIAHHFASLLKLTGGKCTSLKEVAIQLDHVIDFITPVIREVLQKKDVRCDADTFFEVVGSYWARQREAYLDNEQGLVKATRTFVMQELLGFNMQDAEEAYEERWYGAVWEYLSGLNERANYHMQIIARLGETQRELESLYLTMKNVVTYRSLVMLTMWRYARKKGTQRLSELLSAEDDQEDWTLVYGTFIRDYEIFSIWHTRGFEGRQVHLNLYYIDFNASQESEAIHLDMASPVRDCQSPVSFAAIFVHHKCPLGLSYMATQNDMLSSVSSSRAREEDEEAVAEMLRKQQEKKSVAGGMKSYLFSRG